MKHIIVSVTNDLTSDQRVHKACTYLQGLGFEILLIGRELPQSKSLHRKYLTKRMRLLFKKGFLFYAAYNFRLFLLLLFRKKDVLLANDLDTLLPNYLISKLFGIPLVYDSHELFTEVPELKSRPRVQKVWLTIERFIFPKLKYVYTVNTSIANIYSKKYTVPVKVIRNVAPKQVYKSVDIAFVKKVKASKKMLILQGSGINIDRGAEEAVEMMQYLNNHMLYIIGGGDVFDTLRALVVHLNLSDRVIIKDKLPYVALMQYTKIADLGLSLDKATNLNYEYSLPNKIFDYIQANTPLLVSNRKEVAQLVLENNIGEVVVSLEPKSLAKQVENMLNTTEKVKIWQENLEKAAEIYTWENESKVLTSIFKEFV